MGLPELVRSRIKRILKVVSLVLPNAFPNLNQESVIGAGHPLMVAIPFKACVWYARQQRIWRQDGFHRTQEYDQTYDLMKLCRNERTWRRREYGAWDWRRKWVGGGNA
jgi:hypothetical protein